MFAGALNILGSMALTVRLNVFATMMKAIMLKARLYTTQNGPLVTDRHRVTLALLSIFQAFIGAFLVNSSIYGNTCVIMVSYMKYGTVK